MNSSGKINEIINLIEVGGFPFKDGVAHQSFGVGPGSLNIVGNEKVIIFNELITSCYEEDKEVHSSFSRETFVDKLLSFIRPKVLSNNVCTKEEIKTFFEDLKAIEKKEYLVYRGIFGITISDKKSILTIGNFKIYHFPSQKEHFKASVKHNTDFMSIPREPEFLIEYKTEAREQKRAIELADNFYKKFVLFLRYIIGTTGDRYEVGILDFYGWRAHSAYVFSGEIFFQDMQRTGIIEPIPIDAPYFKSADAGFDKLWELIDKKNPTKLEKRISTAVEWLGRSLFERTIQAAFIEASVAIESIFTHQEKTIITPSILSQISESVALLLGSTLEQRIDIEKEIKKLYGLRSGIVHAGDKDVDLKEYEIFINYVRGVIQKLLTDTDFGQCKNVEEMYSKLKRIKYS